MKDSVNSRPLVKLFLVFLEIGAFTFGGGYAMIALLEHEFIEKRNWISKDEFVNMVAIAESTPGPIAINCATFIGYKINGIAGALTATCAICVPSVIIIMIVSMVYDTFLKNIYVAEAFWGIRICVVYLIGSVGIKLLKEMENCVTNYMIAGGIFAVMVATFLLNKSCSAILLILICGLMGVVLYSLNICLERRKQ